MNSTAKTASSFLDALHADGPAPDRGGNMDLYGWLVGSWDLELFEPSEAETKRRRSGEWHFGWVLEGRAINDVWIVPPRGQREGDAVSQDHYYGTTLRVYDPRIDAWHIQFTDPVSQSYLVQVGRKHGDDIVQVGHNADGAWRWSFLDIGADSFLWRGEISVDGGTTWRRHLEFRGRRTD